MSTTPRILGGRYEVGELIGRGGMADVHLGHDTRLGRQVAIKMLRSDLARDANFLMRFRREAQSAAGLNHPAIVAIFDSGEDESLIEGPGGVATTLPYMVMEYVDGKTLREKLNEQGKMSPAEAIEYTEGVLDALALSHRMGIVHRDIKPANVMITSGGHVKVMDFGIARAIADTAATMTQTQSVVGTAQYLSPEQAQGQTVDARSDLYSTGCLLFELLTARPPFQGDSPVAIAYQHVGETPPAPSLFNEAVAGDLDAVTLHSLAKDREARYQDASSFKDDLENVRLGRPISDAARGSGAAAGAGATQTLPAPYSAAGTPTAVTPTVAKRSDRYENTAGLPSVGYDESGDRDRRGGGGKAALITLLVLAVLGAVGWGGVTWFSNQRPDVIVVSVPSLKGMDAATAARTLATYKLQGEPTEASNEAEVGKVFAQDPQPGLKVNQGSTVKYSVSTGPDQVSVPDVKGFNQDEARGEIEKAGLAVSKIVLEDVPDVDKGKVISTVPAGGELVSKDSAVEIHVASGKVVVPDDQVGRDWALAASALSDAGLNPIKKEVESDKPAGEVLKVEKSGEKIDVGSDITVEVAKPKATPPTTETVTTTVTAPPTSTDATITLPTVP